MCESAIPASLAVVAAPILKLCVAYRLSLIPAFDSVADIRAANFCLVRNDPSSRVNSGPGLAPLIARKGRIAETGRRLNLFFLGGDQCPGEMGQFFDCLIVTITTYGGG